MAGHAYALGARGVSTWDADNLTVVGAGRVIDAWGNMDIRPEDIKGQGDALGMRDIGGKVIEWDRL